MSSSEETKGTDSLLSRRDVRVLSTKPTADETGHWKALTLENKPTWVLPTPFQLYHRWDEQGWGPGPFTTFELTMCELSWALRSKPDWQRKATDPEIRSKWRQEALQQQADAAAEGGRPFDCSVSHRSDAELNGYAEIADNEKGIERACFDGIWYSDRLISSDVLERLKNAVKTLEDVPEDKKDWHPGSNKQVLDLVHPSLYCVVYGRTHAAPPEADLPVYVPGVLVEASDFTVDSEGSVKLASSYINNLHPVLHRPMYGVIEEVLTAFVPMFERVLGDSNRKNDRVAFSNGERLEEIECIWGRDGRPYPEDEPSGDEDEDEFNENFWRTVKKVIPTAKEYTGQLQARFSPVSLRGRTIQCIVKLANIHLTPEEPEYGGGSWHVEGMVNERIVASGIYYYDEENIDESMLSFRVAVGPPDYHDGRDDSACTNMLYDMDRDSELIQDLGSVVTSVGCTLSWPNLFQHCVAPFELADPSKRGHRKILAIFFVDPTKDRIVSTTDVSPQQTDWASMAFEDACREPSSVLGAMPQELRDLVKDNFPETVMTLKEAEDYRLKLMKERTVFTDAHAERYVQTFNMCEH
ncbi:hypothetical protein MSAN_01173700 [Mycena sanguinolenta]|uniref:Uncharacterized protein n=1 Tax=Mycena sanguinolenta TaxID=230812 RepID=A0A8H7D781_9AGAR|nr:hypothetical protein MSAN_01173700 [Mycena sanguinolenta]